MPLYDYVCDCGHQFEDIVRDADEEVACPECGQVAERQDSTAHIFNTIIPTYPGAQQRKAGYQHKHLNIYHEYVYLNLHNIYLHKHIHNINIYIDQHHLH